jgi:uncharacterized tellurite resistance protein B-like protein
MEFSLTERLAIVKALVEMAAADGVLSVHETQYMVQLSRELGFDETFIPLARQMNLEEAVNALRAMNHDKKDALALMLTEMAAADGEIDDKEFSAFASIIRAAGIIP